MCILPFFNREVQVCVDVYENVFKETQPPALGILCEVKHLLHVFHVTRVTAVQLFQGLFVAVLCLQQTQGTHWDTSQYIDTLPYIDDTL